MAFKVLIVGAGVAGLTTLKQCLAKGFAATIFEAQNHTGGQWRYTEPDEKGQVHSSVYHGCVFNSCRDTSAFSDFPLDPARYTDYFGHTKFVQYLDEYVQFFGLDNHIRYDTKVIQCEQTVDGTWKVVFEQNGVRQTDIFDALFACTGHTWSPSIPKFEGLSDFEGEFQHSHTYRTPARFEGKKVALIGLGSSAVDIASEIGPQTEECHLITRKGGWVIPKFILGKPVEAWDSRLTTYLPPAFSQWVQTALLTTVMGKMPSEIRPKHKILAQSPTLSSDFVDKINVGTVTPHRAGIERFTKDGIILTNGKKLEVDSVVACTGYLIDYPYLPSDSYRVNESKFVECSNTVDLYKLIVPPNYRNLFFIGLIETFGPGMSVYEAQARWAVDGVLSGKVVLPPATEMQRWSAEFQLDLAKRLYETPRHTILVESNVGYIDDLTKPFNANPTLLRLLKLVFTSNPLRALSILNSVYMEVTNPSQYRLFGEGACPELAAATILRISGGKDKFSEAEEKGLEKLKQEWTATRVKDV